MDHHTKNTPDTNQTRIVKKTVPTESFFNFFSPPQAPSDDDDADDDDAVADIEDRLELDYQLGEDIKEKLIPRAIDWFTGEALAFEEESDEDGLDGEDFDDDDEDEDDMSEDHDEDEESDEEVSTPLEIFVHYAIADQVSFRTSLANPSRRLLSASKVECEDILGVGCGSIVASQF